ncbi:MAG: transporter [Verrucomicrobiales bacterium]|nr:transporter [Verrucomicrobiales bacterium]
MMTTSLSTGGKRAGALAVSLLCGIAAQAQFQGNYPIGVEGLKGGTLPPPGLYLRDYNLFYFSDRLNDRDGNEIPIDFEAFGYANAIRPVWITSWQVLGGYYGMDVLVPLIYKDVSAPGAIDSEFNVGDIFVEPITLSWHWKQADLGVGYGFWAPTGYFDPPANTGQGAWAHMMTLGGTVYADTNKTWAVSALARYEINYENGDLQITPGNTLSLEWSVSKTLAKFYDVGIVGYWQQQTTEDSGPGRRTDALDSVVAVGPEVSIFCPKWKLFTSLRYNYEVFAADRPQGHTVTLTLTKIF